MGCHTNFRNRRVTLTNLSTLRLNESERWWSWVCTFGSEMGLVDFIALTLGALFLFKAFDFTFWLSFFCFIWSCCSLFLSNLCYHEEEARYPFSCCEYFAFLFLKIWSFLLFYAVLKLNCWFWLCGFLFLLKICFFSWFYLVSGNWH